MAENDKYRILIVDDHPIVRDGLIRLIEIGNTMHVCGETGDGGEVMGLIAETKPELVILDLTLETADGMSLIGCIKSRYPGLPVLVLSMHDESTHALRCIREGARGYLMKSRLSFSSLRVSTIFGSPMA